MLKKKLAFLLCVMLILSLTGYAVCKTAGGKKIEDERKEVLLVTSFYPMYLLAQNLVPEEGKIAVVNLTENQTGCLHDYQLTAKDMRLLSDADAFLVNGAGMELFIESVLEEIKDLSVIEATKGMTLLEGSAHEHNHEEPEHGREEEADHAHHEQEKNGHVWMDVIRYREQANVAARELQVLFPAYATEIKESYEQYEEKLATLSEEVQLLREEVKGQNVVIFHDAFAYLADSLSMHVIGVVALDEETVPSAGEIAELIEEIKYHGGAWILIEEAYASHAEKIVAETGARVLYLNPLVTGDGEKNSYLVGMRENIKVIREAVYGEALEGTTE